MTTEMGRAMQAAFERQEEQRRASAPFQPDPYLEQMGAQLDQLQRDNPPEYAGPGLARLRTSVTTYRRRKAEHEQQESR